MKNHLICLVWIVLVSCTEQEIPKIEPKSSNSVQPLTECTDTVLVYTIKKDFTKIHLYWKDREGNPYKYFYELNQQLNSINVETNFMMNAGMFMENSTPLGLLIQEGKCTRKINKYTKRSGNFYNQPNGVFYIDYTDKAYICTTQDFICTKDIRIATQSGPILVLNGSITESSKRRTDSITRNGVGILPNGDIIFVIALNITMVNFAKYFKNKKCKVALNLDGGISDVYYPSKNKPEGGGSFGPILVITK
jgi:uncharacterized protein YigE (DUF2233 family)